MSLAVQAHEKLLAEGKRSRVVSILSQEIFEHQTQAYQDTVLPPNVYARCGGTGLKFWMGTLCRQTRSAQLHEDVWGFSAAQGAAKKIWVRT